MVFGSRIGAERRKKGGCEVREGRLNRQYVRKERKVDDYVSLIGLTWNRRAPLYYRQKDEEHDMEGYQRLLWSIIH